MELQSLLARMVAAGVSGVAMEVSSHALALHRVDGTEFDVAVFTNLTQDHLDLHGTMEEYRRAKARLFALLAASRKAAPAAVINADDPAGPSLVEGRRAAHADRSAWGGRDVRPEHFTSSAAGIEMGVRTPSGRLRVTSPLVGEHNVMNLLGAVGVGLALGLDGPTIERALAGVDAVPGRFERVEAGQPFLVAVDYAHTPDALERVLHTARKLVAPGAGSVSSSAAAATAIAASDPSWARSRRASPTGSGSPRTTREASGRRPSSTTSCKGCGARPALPS